MNVYRGSASAGIAFPKASLCIGSFDGVHLGHRALFEVARSHGPAMVLTFEPHPAKVLHPEVAPPLIATLDERLALIEAAGVEALVLQEFSAEYARSASAVFEVQVFDILQAGLVVVGADFRYGRNRSGTPESLQRAAKARGVNVEIIPRLALNGIPISSTKIREHIQSGRVEEAERLLGRPFAIEGVVSRGMRRGRLLGFPTANVEAATELIPGNGVYAVAVRLPDGVWKGGAASVGVNPTFADTERTIEAHLFDFDGDLYGKELRVVFLSWLRPERRFETTASLVKEIAADVAVAREVLALRDLNTLANNSRTATQ